MQITLQEFFINNLPIIHFIYGTSYLLITTMILTIDKKDSDFEIARVFYLFILYALPHSISDYITTWALLKNYSGPVLTFSKLLTYFSYIFLFEFGRRLLVINNGAKWRKTKYFYIIIPLLITGSATLTGKPNINIDPLIGYFLRLPAGIIISLGLRQYYKNNENKLSGLKLYKYFFSCGAALMAWAFFCGIIRDKGTFFPANILNIDTFFQITSIPVYLFRAVLGLIVLWSMHGILSIFNWETRIRIKNLYEKEKKTKDNLNNIITNIADIMIVINKNKEVIYFNPAASELLGYHPQEIEGKSIDPILIKNDFIAQAIDDLLKNSKTILKYEQTLITKDDIEIPVLMTLSSYQNNYSDSPDIIIIGKDIKELKRIEKDLREAYSLKTKELILRTEELESTCKTLKIEKSAHKETAEGYYEAQYFLKTIMDNISDSILVINRDNTIRMVNRSAQEQFNIDQFIPDNFQCHEKIKLNNPFCFSDLNSCPLKVIEQTLEPYVMERKCYNELSRKEEYCEIVASPFFDHNNEFSGIVEVIRNITKRKELEKEIISISEKERYQIGLEIHDDIAQNLAAIDILCKIIQNDYKNIKSFDPERLDNVIEIISSTLTNSRRLAKGLSPISLHSEDIIEMIQNLCTETRSIFNIDCTYEIGENIPDIDEFTLIQIYYIIKESLTNIVKHSSCSAIQITLLYENDNLILNIEDNGIGFTSIEHANGMGLKIMKYRAEVINAKLFIQSAKNQGTLISLFFQDKKFKMRQEVCESK